MAKSCFNLNYFLILTLLVFFMLLYVYIGVPKRSVERFAAPPSYKLISPDKIVVSQGMATPDVPMEPTQYDAGDVSAPSVDGTEEGPKSKFFFAYNECKPECCPTAGGYACHGGCPCFTADQKKFSHSRGFNSRAAKCGFDVDKDI